MMSPTPQAANVQRARLRHRLQMGSRPFSRSIHIRSNSSEWSLEKIQFRQWTHFSDAMISSRSFRVLLSVALATLSSDDVVSDHGYARAD